MFVFLYTVLFLVIYVIVGMVIFFVFGRKFNPFNYNPLSTETLNCVVEVNSSSYSLWWLFYNQTKLILVWPLVLFFAIGYVMGEGIYIKKINGNKDALVASWYF